MLRGIPKHDRSNNRGPEIVARTVPGRLTQNQLGPLLIEPNSPCQSGYAANPCTSSWPPARSRHKRFREAK